MLVMMITTIGTMSTAVFTVEKDKLSYDGQIVWCINGTNTFRVKKVNCFVKFTLEEQIYERCVRPLVSKGQMIK